MKVGAGDPAELPFPVHPNQLSAPEADLCGPHQKVLMSGIPADFCQRGAPVGDGVGVKEDSGIYYFGSLPTGSFH